MANGISGRFPLFAPVFTDSGSLLNGKDSLCFSHMKVDSPDPAF